MLTAKILKDENVVSYISGTSSTVSQGNANLFLCQENKFS